MRFLFANGSRASDTAVRYFPEVGIRRKFSSLGHRQIRWTLPILISRAQARSSGGVSVASVSIFDNLNAAGRPLACSVTAPVTGP